MIQPQHSRRENERAQPRMVADPKYAGARPLLALAVAHTPSYRYTLWPLHALAVTRSGRYDGSYKGSYKLAAHDGEMGGRRAGGPWKLGEARPAVLAKALLE